MKSWLTKLFAHQLDAQTQEQLTVVLQQVCDELTGQTLDQWLIEASQNPLGLRLVFAVPYAAQSLWSHWRTQLITAAKTKGLNVAQIDFQPKIVARVPQNNMDTLPGIANIIAVGSGKGGVGKSTTAANLALALAAEGARVGILDADIYGPSMPVLFGAQGQIPHSVDGKMMEPIERYGIRMNSIGFLVEPDSPMIWRGPIVTGSLLQLINETRWGELDYLVVDLPPGTGDTQLTLAQKIPVAGAIIVTTPQDLAMIDARKGLKMFEKVNISVLGIVENMATHVCSQCGHVEAIFGEGGGEKMAADFQVPLLASLPLSMSVREQADLGKPTMVAYPQDAVAQTYLALARKVGAQLALRPQSFASKFGKIEVKSV